MNVGGVKRCPPFATVSAPRRLHFRAMRPSLPVDNEPPGDMSKLPDRCTI